MDVQKTYGLELPQLSVLSCYFMWTTAILFLRQIFLYSIVVFFQRTILLLINDWYVVNTRKFTLKKKETVPQLCFRNEIMCEERHLLTNYWTNTYVKGVPQVNAAIYIETLFERL